MQTSPTFDLVIDVDLSAAQIGEQELTLVRQYLPELLKEMLWQTSEAKE